jgi:hypothetical protein
VRSAPLGFIFTCIIRNIMSIQVQIYFDAIQSLCVGVCNLFLGAYNEKAVILILHFAVPETRPFKTYSGNHGQ